MSFGRTTPHGDAYRPAGGRLRRAVLAVVIAALAFTAVAVPASAASSRPAGAAASQVLCGGWQGCNKAGYDSYGYGQHLQTSYWRMDAGNECTNYVAYVEATYFQAPAPGYLLGNAYQWSASAAAHGVVVNKAPSIGSVAVWASNAYGMGADGHVAVVEAVGPHDSYIVVSQQHLLGVPNGYEWTRINAGFPASSWEPWPSAFIHFTLGRRVAAVPVPGRYHHRARARARRRALRQRRRRARIRHRQARRRALRQRRRLARIRHRQALRQRRRLARIRHRQARRRALRQRRH